jgi:molybdopterin-containing oxidoreductase family membrane subunit
VKDNVVDLLAKISGWMLGTYMVAKIADTAYWAFQTVPRSGFRLMDFYSGLPEYGIWMLIAELGVCGIVPAVLLLWPRTRRSSGGLWLAVILATVGICLNRWAMVVQVLAIPVLPFENWVGYFPSWQEIATTVLPVAYGVLLVMISYRYLPVFPQEAELNPLPPEDVGEPASDKARSEVGAREPKPRYGAAGA